MTIDIRNIMNNYHIITTNIPEIMNLIDISDDDNLIIIRRNREVPLLTNPDESIVEKFGREIIDTVSNAKKVLDELIGDLERTDERLLNPFMTNRFRNLPYLLASPVDKLSILVENPECGLTPMQQVLFSLLVGKFIRILRTWKKERTVILITDSPYILAGGKLYATISYIHYDGNDLVVENRPYAVFALAEVLALSLTDLL